MAKYHIPFFKSMADFDVYLRSEIERLKECETEIKLSANHGADLTAAAIAKAKATQAT